DNVQNRTYPLTRDVYYYLKHEKGKPIDPKAKEFLRYVLSREGQEAVQRDGKYLPLTAEAVREQLKKLGGASPSAASDGGAAARWHWSPSRWSSGSAGGAG